MEAEDPTKYSLLPNTQHSKSEHCNQSDNQATEKSSSSGSSSETDGSKPNSDHEGTANSRQDSRSENMSHHNRDNDFGAQYASMIHNAQYSHPYDPYTTHTIIGQSGLPLSIPYGLLQYAQFQEDTRLAKNKGLRRGKWTVGFVYF